MKQNELIKVVICLSLGLLAIVYFNPLHTPCQSQISLYNQSLKPLIKSFNRGSDLCHQHTDQGGCLPFLDATAKFEAKLRELGNQCQADLASDSTTQGFLKKSMELIVRGAWGSKPPASYLYRNGWMELTHVVLYCRLRNDFIKIFGDEASTSFTNAVMGDLPGAEGLERNDVWARSLLSEPCKYNF